VGPDSTKVGETDMRFHTKSTIALVATLLSAAPAAAVVTTFATFSPGAGGSNVRFGNALNNSNAVFYTTATNSSLVPAARAVTFTFLQNQFNSIGPINARWNMAGFVVNTPAIISGNMITQRNIAGSFSFLNTSAITLGSTTYAAGSNLLSGTFNKAEISGVRNGTSAGFSGSTPSSAITYTSDFLTFAPGSNYDFSMFLGQISPALNALPTNLTPTRALRTFRATANGQFSSDPAPIAVVPEPATWLQMIAGFGFIGFAARQRKRKAAVTA
jgi:hypothetical protein